MICNIGYKKIFISTSLIFLSVFAQSQLRSDGYYSLTEISTSGDTTFQILYFRSNGIYADSGGKGMAPILRQALAGTNNLKYTYRKGGGQHIIRYEHINMGQYYASNYPCKAKVRIENDGLFFVASRTKEKGWMEIKRKYLFVPFTK